MANNSAQSETEYLSSQNTQLMCQISTLETRISTAKSQACALERENDQLRTTILQLSAQLVQQIQTILDEQKKRS